MQAILKNFFLIVLFGTAFVGCKSLAPKSSVNYEYLQLVHLGDGQIDMRVTPGSSRSWLNVMVASCDHQPVNKQVRIQVTDESSEVFDDFYNAINGQVPLTEPAESNLKSDRYWQRIQFVQGNHSTDITNILLQERFKVLEKVVREVLASKSAF